jgi:hypothetical protein
MSWFCRHKWKIGRRRFVPPAEHGITKAWGHEGLELAQKSMFGYTVRTFVCEKCDKSKTDYVIGDERE